MKTLMKKFCICFSVALMSALFSVPASSAEPDCYRVNIEREKLRVRACAGAECEVVGELQRGDEVCPTQITGDWAEFLYENVKGYISAKYLYACPNKSGPLQTLEAAFLREEWETTSGLFFAWQAARK